MFYFDGPVLRAVKVDTLEDRELYRVPSGYKPVLPTCTADGRYVAFQSAATNLVAGDNNGFSDIFVKTPASGVLELISGTPAGSAGNGPSEAASMSPDGRYVARSYKADGLMAMWLLRAATPRVHAILAAAILFAGINGINAARDALVTFRQAGRGPRDIGYT